MSAAAADRPTGGVAETPYPEVLEALRAGEPVLLVDRTGRDDAHLIAAASAITVEQTAFLVRNTSGFLCVALPAARADELELPALPSTAAAPAPGRPAYAVSVDARAQTSTGISAADRARTARLLADPDAQASAFARPGHVVPIRVAQHARLGLWGVADAALAVARAAEIPPAVVVAALVDGDGTPPDATGIADFSAAHGIRLVSRQSVAARATLPGGERPTALVATAFGAFAMHELGDAVVLTRLAPGTGLPPLLRIRPGGRPADEPLPAGAFDALLQPVAADDHGMLLLAPTAEALAPVLRELRITAARVLDTDAYTAAALVRHGVEIVHRIPVVDPGPADGSEWRS